jgi:hypothetical protein
MRPFPAPVIDDRELYQRDRQLLDHDVLKHAHQRELIADLQSHVIAKECVNKFEFIIFIYHCCRYPPIAGPGI